MLEVKSANVYLFCNDPHVVPEVKRTCVIKTRSIQNSMTNRQYEDDEENEESGKEETAGYLFDYISGKQVKATPEEKMPSTIPPTTC